ncbi:MAG: DPP IV N-terminal domain-containing protein [Lentimicrobiaceae bacterium]|jgi:dipeptidyl-peptidase-4
MNKKSTFTLLALLLMLVSQIFAQQKQLAIEDLMNRKLYPSSLSNLQWRNNNLFTWNANNCIVQGDVKTGTNDSILTLDELNLVVEKNQQKKLKSIPAFKWENENTFRYTNDAKVFRFKMLTKDLTLVNSYEPEGENAEFEPNSGRIAFTKDNNLFVSENGKTTAVTNDSDKGIVNGQTVHRNEFGIDGGIFWSPIGNLLAFYRMDESMVTQYPLVDIDTRIATVDYIRYPMAGMASHHVTVGVFDPVNQQVIFLKTGEPAEQYLTNITWSPDEKYIFIAVLNRDQNHMWLNKYDAITGDFVKTLFEETDNEYVEPLHGLYFLKTNPSQFIWQSRRDGFNHLYLYNSEGNLIKQITKGPWEVTDYQGFDLKETKIFYNSTQESPLERHLYSVELKTGKTVKYTSTKGTHTTLASPDGKYMLDRMSSLNVGSQTSLLNSKGQITRTLTEDINPLKDYKLGITSFVTLKADDGSDLYGRLILPVGFDPSKKYPTLVYVYGGPHSQLVTDTWLGGATLFLTYLATKGYVVWTLDNRGTSYRGADFEQIIHRHLGDVESKDQMVGVNYLKSLPYVDSTRIGIDGWSYGGFMTLTLKLRNPGVFKVATCGGPVIDWKLYEIMYGERYMDTPEQNPEGYKKACLLNYVDQLDGKVLVIHDAQDKTVVWQNSLQFIQTCIKKGKQIDYFVYPNHEHNVSGKDRLHLYRKLAEYYDQNL